MAGDGRNGLKQLIAAIILIFISMVIWSCIPLRPESYSALPVEGRIGQEIIGRNIAATVHNVYASHHISSSVGTLGVRTVDYYSKGYWIVVDATYGTLIESSQMKGLLRAGSTQTGIRANVGDESTLPYALQPGLQYRSVLVFEVPTMGHVMELALLNSFKDERTGAVMDPPLDSQITVEIPPQSVQERSRIVIDRSRVR
ncbi:hypothetical protein [Mycobacteroides chelonae]|uniref:hypothetical protein n=1 Tax=Mycobacteroides chelonae TaxID=1774 RepID=UPI0008A8AC51|nr:hypothetical protein [Mycobacteroides chelonae]OHU61607.1 hypothetical protein BKG85_21685 [Mycobacteroides chelonae]